MAARGAERRRLHENVRERAAAARARLEHVGAEHLEAIIRGWVVGRRERRDVPSGLSTRTSSDGSGRGVRAAYAKWRGACS